MTPFSGARYHENSRKCRDGEEPCAVCGKPCRADWNQFVHVVDGGAAFGTLPETDPDTPGDMGLFPVGSECARKLQKLGVVMFDRTGKPISGKGSA